MPHFKMLWRRDRTYGEVMRTMIMAAGLPNMYWSYALLHAVYIKNRLPHSTLGMTPYKKMAFKKPDLSHLFFYDTITHQTRQTRHVEFDGAYLYASNAPPYAQKLKNIAETSLANKQI